MEQCVRCPHPKGAHDPGDGSCRLNGCGCPSYLAEDAPKSDPAETVVGPRRISVDVPDGYMITVTLVPYTAEQADD